MDSYNNQNFFPQQQQITPQQMIQNQFMSRFSPPPQGLNCFIVNNVEQFMNAQPNQDGSITLFANFANGRIYTNRLDKNTGQVDMREYIINEKPVRKNNEFVSHADFIEFQNNLMDKLTSLLKGVDKNAIQSMGTTSTKSETATEPNTNINGAGKKGKHTSQSTVPTVSTDGA